MMLITVGSKNPVKIEAVRQAFAKVWPDKKLEVVGFNVASGVSIQPMSDKESLEGARNRAKRAFEKETEADFAVGLEGGLEEMEGKWFDCGWIVIWDKGGKEGVATTLRMETPPEMMKMVKEGMELGMVDDKLFERENSKQAEGHFGLMTNNLLTRTESYRDAVIAALVRFIKNELFELT